MSLAQRVTVAITVATLSSIVIAGVLVRKILGAYLAPFAQHFLMMQRTLGWGPDLQTIHDLIDRALFIAMLAALVLALLVGTVLGRGLARSVTVLRDGFKRYAEGRLEDRITVAGASEIESIAAGVNRMAEQLRDARFTERELVAGLAHDLAHPLTAMRGTLEAARDGLTDLANPDVLKRLISGISELDEAVGDLRDIAAAEIQALRLHVDVVHLKPLIERVAGIYVDLAGRKGIALRTESADATVRTDERRLGRVLANLVTNALQATPTGGSVTIESRAEQSRAVLRVEDAAGPQAASRIRNALEHGVDAGLGLRVVRFVGRALDARIRVRAGARGAIVEVDLPLYVLSTPPPRVLPYEVKLERWNGDVLAELRPLRIHAKSTRLRYKGAQET